MDTLGFGHMSMGRMGRALGRICLVPALLILLISAGTARAGAFPDSGEIRIVTPQWEGQTNPDGTGLFFELLRAVYEPSGIRFSFALIPWKRCQALVRSGQKDAMLCVWATHAREQRQLIPKLPMYIEQTVAVVKKASQLDWKGMHAMDYRRAVWLRGYNYQRDRHMAGIQLGDWEEVDTYKEAWQQLDLDRVDIYIDARIDVEKYLETLPAPELYQLHPLWKEKAYVAFSDTPRSRELIRIYDREMKKLLASGRLAGIYAKWRQPFDPADWAD